MQPRSELFIWYDFTLRLYGYVQLVASCCSNATAIVETAAISVDRRVSIYQQHRQLSRYHIPTLGTGGLLSAVQCPTGIVCPPPLWPRAQRGDRNWYNICDCHRTSQAALRGTCRPHQRSGMELARFELRDDPTSAMTISEQHGGPWLLPICAIWPGREAARGGIRLAGVKTPRSSRAWGYRPRLAAWPLPQRHAALDDNSIY